MLVPQLLHLPRKESQLTMGILCQGLIGVLHDGQFEAGFDKVSGSGFSLGSISKKTSQSLRQVCCIMAGNRRITTFKKLPMTAPSKKIVGYHSALICASASSSAIGKPSGLYHRAQHKDRQVHCNHQATDQYAEHRHDHGL